MVEQSPLIKVTITTSGQHCAAVATDRGDGTVTVKNSILNINGKGSPCVYSTGTISVSDSKGTATNSSLSISKKSKVYETSPMFFITNTDAVINLENTKLNYGSNQLVTVSGNDGEWGNQGSNGGNLTFNAANQTLSENSAKEVNLSLDSSSKWVVTEDSYVTTLTLENNDLSLIEDNGYTIYYNASANSWLNGQTITLSNNGTLTPIQ